MKRFVTALLACLLLSSAALGQSANTAPASPAQTALPRSRGILCSIKSANMNVTTDQACPIKTSVAAYRITGLYVTNCSVSMTTAAGGVYPTTSKGGTPIVAATQVYTTATAATVIVDLTEAATPLVTRYVAANVYLALTTPQGATATCDFYVVGDDDT